MENEKIEETLVSETYQIKEEPTLWKWYFGWHPRIFLTLPIFVLFVYSGIWFIWTELKDIVFFFQTTPVTWGAIFLIVILGSVFLMLLLAPIYICFLSIS